MATCWVPPSSLALSFFSKKVFLWSQVFLVSLVFLAAFLTRKKVVNSGFHGQGDSERELKGVGLKQKLDRTLLHNMLQTGTVSQNKTPPPRLCEFSDSPQLQITMTSQLKNVIDHISIIITRCLHPFCIYLWLISQTCETRTHMAQTK